MSQVDCISRIAPPDWGWFILVTPDHIHTSRLDCLLIFVHYAVRLGYCAYGLCEQMCFWSPAVMAVLTQMICNFVLLQMFAYMAICVQLIIEQSLIL